MNIIEQKKLELYKKSYPKILTAEEALDKAIDCEQEAKTNANNREHWFQCQYELTQLAALLEKQNNDT